MPSYADEYAARHPELQGRNSGPVRLTISRGDSIQGPNGQYSYSERWEQEEIMDVESAGSIDDEIEAEASASLQTKQTHGDQLVDTIRKRISLGRRNGDSRSQTDSLLVLDTNTLISSLPFVMTLFSQCLSRNVFALSHSTFPPSPISLIIPNTVLSELDNLKTSSRGGIGVAARAANNWILTSLQSQKKQMYDVKSTNLGSVSTRERIPERSWVLHVENTAHASALKNTDRASSNLTPDEEIVRLCMSLRKQAGLEIFFVSDDTNARTKAEIEGLPTFSFKALISDAHGNGASKEELVQLATDLIEQWQAQIQDSGQTAVIEKIEEDEQGMELDPHQSTGAASMTTRGRTTQHSNHAVIPPSTNGNTNTTATHNRSARTSPSSHRYNLRRQQQQKAQITNGTNKTHQYPDDRSTSSSMWAIRN